MIKNPTVNADINYAKQQFAEAISTVMSFVNEGCTDNSALLPLLPKLTLLQSLLFAPVWATTLRNTSTTASIVWGNDIIPALTVKAWWSVRPTQPLFVKDTYPGSNPDLLRPDYLPDCRPHLRIKWFVDGVKKGRFVTLEHDGMQPIVRAGEQTGMLTYERPAHVLVSDLLFSIIEQWWMVLFSVYLPRDTVEQKRAQDTATLRHAVAVTDTRYLAQKTLEADQDYAALSRARAMLAEALTISKGVEEDAEGLELSAEVPKWMKKALRGLQNNLLINARRCSRVELPINPYRPIQGTAYEVSVNAEGYLINEEINSVTYLCRRMDKGGV